MSASWPKRGVYLNIPKDLIDPWAKWMTENGIVSETESIYTMLRMMISATPMDGYVQQARVKAYNDASKWIFDRLTESLREIKVHLDSSKRGA